jgi:hypothetical protein
MDKVVEMVLKSFEANRKMAEDAIRDRKREMSGHKHGIFCFGWRYCRKIERAVIETEGRIEEYKEAERGLIEGNYNKAVELLSRISGQIDETPWEVAMRVASTPPTLEGILNSRTSIAFRMRQARDYLVSLQVKSGELQTS